MASPREWRKLPRKCPEDRYSEALLLRMTPGQKRDLCRRAYRRGVWPSQFVRHLIEEVAAIEDGTEANRGEWSRSLEAEPTFTSLFFSRRGRRRFLG